MTKPNAMHERKRTKAQSAMEYLMTYGWSILILAVVIAALYLLGVFNAFSTINGCISTPGYLCTGLKFSTNMNDYCGINNEYKGPSISLTLGSTASDWTNVFFAVVPYGQQITDTNKADEQNKNDFFYWSTYVGHATWYPTFNQGQEQQMSICVDPGLIGEHVGSQFKGGIWAMYSTPTTTNAVVEVAVFSVAASR